MSRLTPFRPLIFLVLGLLAFVLFLALPPRMVEYLWMDNLGFASVFWRNVGLRTGLFLVGFVLATMYFAANVWFIYSRFSVLRWRTMFATERGPTPEFELTPSRFRMIGFGVAAFLGLFFALQATALSSHTILFLSNGSTGIAEPIFGRDVSFYLLKLPLLGAMQSFVLALGVLGIALTVGAHVWIGSVTVDKGKLIAPRPVIRQLSVNISVFLLAWAAGYFLRRYELLYTSGGTVFGIGYIDHNILIPVYWVMIVATLILVGLVIMNLQKARARLLGVAVVGYFMVMILGLGVVPAIIQRFSVEPNELQREHVYLENNIEFTRWRTDSTSVEEREYPAETTLTYADVVENNDIIRNIRLWDPRLLIQTFRQLQEIRTYYQFYSVDIDRYEIEGEVRQVMLSAREIAQRLPSQADTWINRHMQYTHGYGIAMNEVADVGPEGTPRLLVQDLPPISDVGFEVPRPEIYYGMGTPTYRIVNTDVPELSYPRGDDNVYTHYDGVGGVQLNSFFRRALFALFHADANIVLSDLIHDQSRMQFWNRVQERVRRVAPFLRLDEDPYLIVTDEGLVWMQDAYTISRTFPYSEPSRRQNLNYIRNSVKVVVNAYHGTVDLYVTEPDDPIIQAYQQFYPGLFRSFDEMPYELRRHLRYPQDMFTIQIERFARYHMTQPQVFYNNEDLWTRPREQYGGQTIAMEPYYVITQLPGETGLEFSLMTPMTPEARGNMIAWIAARSDAEHYGQLVAYKLPKDRLIYGPVQVESRIDQDTEISQQLALWDQRGSRVIRGNLMVIPIERSFLYVEPVFLIADGNQIPQLRRVIVSFGERVAMERTLDEALASIFQEELRPLVARGEVDDDVLAPLLGDRSEEDFRRARETLDRAMEALRDGNFGVFGTRLEELRRILDSPSASRAVPPADTMGTALSAAPASTAPVSLDR
jgi:uncharacterized protein